MRYFDKLDNFRSMEKAGYPDYVVNLRGDIVNIRTRHISYVATRSGSGLNIVKRNKSGESICWCTTSYMVAVAWCDEPEAVWKYSRYARQIKYAKIFFDELRSDFIRPIDHADQYNRQYYVSRAGYLVNSSTFTRTYGTNATSGYIQVALRDEGRSYSKGMHRLVADAFLDVDPALEKAGWDKTNLYIGHINGNKHDNRVENLEWVTPAENTKRDKDAGCIIPKMSEAQLENVFILLSALKTDKEINETLHIPIPTICDIRRRRYEKYDTPNYTWPRTTAEVNKIRKDKLYSQILEKYNSGAGRSIICEELKIPIHVVNNCLSECKDKITREVRSRKPAMTMEQLNQAVEMFRQGKSNSEIAKVLDVDRGCIETFRNRRSFVKEFLEVEW